MGSFPPSNVAEFATFDLTIIDDDIDENNEVYILLITVTSPEPVTLENNGVSRVSITDDDGQYSYNVLIKRVFDLAFTVMM